jgi:hypothetical protein
MSRRAKEFRIPSGAEQACFPPDFFKKGSTTLAPLHPSLDKSRYFFLQLKLMHFSRPFLQADPV